MGRFTGTIFKNRYRLLLLFTISAFLINIHFIYYRIESNQNHKARSNHSSAGSQDNGGLQFVTQSRNPALPCNVTLESAKKSVRRAKSHECRQEIKEAACKLQNGQLYPMRLSRDACPMAEKTKGHFIGCYADDPQRRLLGAHKYDFHETNTPEECIDSCLRIGYQAAGVQYAHECFCGDLEGLKGGKQLEVKACRQFECPGDPSQRCGGFQTIAVYQTGHGVTNFEVKEKRYATIWGGASLLEMILDSLREMLEKWDGWEVALNLSEADFLLLSLEEIEKFLGSYPGHSFLRSHGKGTQKFIGAQGLDRDELTIGLKRFFHFTLLPAESFFHTLAANSKFCNMTVNSNLKLTNWKRKIGCKCQYKHIVDWCGCSPSVFLSEDARRLTRNQAENRLYFTARKFEAIIDQGIIDFAENQSLGPQSASKNRALNHPSYGKYWQNEFHHKDSDSIHFDAVVKNTAANRNTVSKEKNIAQKLFLASIGREVRQRLIGGPSMPSNIRLGTDINPLEMNLFKEAYNSPIQLLIKFQCGCDENSEFAAIETRVLRKAVWKLSPNYKEVVGNWRLVEMEVGTKFDPKEEIFRNYAGVISPESAPSLRHRWQLQASPSEGDGQKPLINITHLVTTWVSPRGTVRYRSPAENVTPDHVIKHTDMEPDELDRALMEPGVWTVQISIRHSVVAEISFPVFPSSADSTSFLQDSKLLGQFFNIKDSCLSKHIDQTSAHNQRISDFDHSKCISSLSQVLPFCAETTWSSEFPDLKSSISSGYDENSKMLV